MYNNIASVSQYIFLTYGETFDHYKSDSGLQCIMERFTLVNIDAFYNTVMSGDESGLCDYCTDHLQTEIDANIYEY